MSFTSTDHTHMAHALRLAELGLCTTQPNPRVGCVIAHGDEVVGAGWHRRAGGPHAEVFALREAGERARGATAYVTLEPCAHHGRTPPCADALVAAGVARVVIAVEDPFPQVAGRGIEKLRAAGIAVDIGLLRDEARALNCGFFSRIERGRPFVRVKLAMSLDGRTALANGESKWITGEAARADVQRWRARSSAILTGSGTVLADNPQLTVRLGAGSAGGAGGSPRAGLDSLSPGSAGGEGRGEGGAFAPLRVVLDRQLRTPSGSHVLDGSAPTLVLHGAGASCADDRYARAGLAAVAERGDALDLAAVLAELAARDVNEVHVEAGPTLCGALFAAGLVDELLLYVAPLLLGDAARPLLKLPTLTDMAARWRLAVCDQRLVGSDMRWRLRPEA
ncbi:bifunctional diaminohydroxyphosphoribosylaminopyrimidine deaminase/5-amino-6-(5-phosphoribosylamino)uracil reductase RibD [Rhodanobacter sp. C06]|uniref:bifunctional diaminohydroxyphosphoribosylaminopyrimidine deaminase/5-amino-6-(5-phosphoribosylamino)uracil reductase RibD n=1 Tax=Rhodanobacter sp. C06 TaxID=1945854 RepID=UPI0020C2DF67|nr:bifunctional diaminohydroxyphosphoribosylaminopyrimidine deaminase/5-amino-6-(5-phosphoribosylamino)uracil reductase RibD [Rhodanobacter sp. C06]